MPPIVDPGAAVRGRSEGITDNIPELIKQHHHSHDLTKTPFLWRKGGEVIVEVFEREWMRSDLAGNDHDKPRNKPQYYGNKFLGPFRQYHACLWP